MQNSFLIVFINISLLVTHTNCSSQESEKSTSVTVHTEKPQESIEVSGALPTQKLKDGNFLDCYADGQLKVSGMVLEGERTGIWVSYFPNGIKQSENIYKNGKLNGKTVVYHSNGQIMYIGYYVNGKPDGQWLYYDEIGNMTKHLNYKLGVPEELPIDEY